MLTSNETQNMNSHSNSRPSRGRAATLPGYSVHRLTLSPFQCNRERWARGTDRDSQFTSHRSRFPTHESRRPKITYEPRHRSRLTNRDSRISRFLIYSPAIRNVRNSQKTNSRPISNLQRFGVSCPPFAPPELPTPTHQSLRCEPRITDHYSPVTSHFVCACGEPLRN
jgi:hypothetical protein